MPALIIALMEALPYILKFVKGALRAGKVLALLPFFAAIAAAIVSVRYAIVHTYGLLGVALTGFETALGNIPLGQSNVLCWVSAFDVFYAANIVITVLASTIYAVIGLMLVTASFQLSNSIMSNITLEAID
jgi:hypothetical protein